MHLRRLSHCLCKKYNELLLSDYTFYSELCKWPPIARNHKGCFHFILLLNHRLTLLNRQYLFRENWKYLLLDGCKSVPNNI